MSILIFIVVFSIIVIVHELGHFITAKKAGVRVEQFSLGFGPKIIGLKRGETEYIICAFLVGAYVKLAGDNPDEFKGQPREYLAKSVGQRARVVFFGPLFNYVFAFLCFWLIFFAGFPELACKVGRVIEDFGAEAAGVQAGDEILAINGEKVKVWHELQEIIQNKDDGEIVTLSVLRDSQRLQLPVKVTQEKVETIWGEKKAIGVIGVEPAEKYVKTRFGLIESFFMAGERLIYFTRLTLKSIAWMASGRISFRQSVTGPLGIFFITKEVAHLGIIPFIQILAIISMALAISNLLPLPMLDGGHLLFLLIEKIRGQRFSTRTELIINQIGYTFIILLTIFVFYNDLLRYNVLAKISEWWSRYCQ
jgi:regulator of sigma E protease